MSARHLVLVLGDQLSTDISSLSDFDPAQDVIVMGELKSEATYVKHHKKKIAFIFSAMRHFAKELEARGYTVEYKAYTDQPRISSFSDLVKFAIKRHNPDKLIVTQAGEKRVNAEMARWRTSLKIPIEIREDDRFFASHSDFAQWASGRKSIIMEYFYREMRKRTGYLMENGEPAGGQWNFDKDNRKPAKGVLTIPEPRRVSPDAVTRTVLCLVDEKFPDHFGDLEPFWFAVTRKDALKALDHFIKAALPNFGDYQDAMLRDEKFLYHSILSMYINAGLLSPKEVCDRAEAAWREGHAPINAVEGFIRQILGWREYIRGVYNTSSETYTDSNFFGASRPLPNFFWTGETDMACVAAAVDQTREEAYAHHIQRLMVTGLFAMLAGIDPHDVHEWYLAVYADAYEWVEAPNVIGMSQYADGGRLASKPYAASGAYINRMSDYCKSCRYKVAKKTEDDACPFNALYWDFLARHQDELARNPRLAQMYRTWGRMKPETKTAYLEKAASVLRALDSGETRPI